MSFIEPNRLDFTDLGRAKLGVLPHVLLIRSAKAPSDRLISQEREQ
jgi:hypothetical protein